MSERLVVDCYSFTNEKNGIFFYSGFISGEDKNKKKEEVNHVSIDS